MNLDDTVIIQTSPQAASPTREEATRPHPKFPEASSAEVPEGLGGGAGGGRGALPSLFMGVIGVAGMCRMCAPPPNTHLKAQGGAEGGVLLMALVASHEETPERPPTPLPQGDAAREAAWEPGAGSPQTQTRPSSQEAGGNVSCVSCPVWVTLVTATEL